LKIYPTHTCFDDSLDLIAEWIKVDNSQVKHLFLVHGICLLENNEPYSHAWVERKNKCFFVGIIEGKRETLAVSKKAYYQRFKVQEATRYSVRQAWEHNRISNNYGPWEERYLKLCRDYSVRYL